MSRHPYPPSPETVKRNQRTRHVLDVLARHTVSDGHHIRARTRVASRYAPPTIPTDAQVLAIVAETAPTEEAPA